MPPLPALLGSRGRLEPDQQLLVIDAAPAPAIPGEVLPSGARVARIGSSAWPALTEALRGRRDAALVPPYGLE